LSREYNRKRDNTPGRVTSRHFYISPRRSPRYSDGNSARYCRVKFPNVAYARCPPSPSRIKTYESSENVGERRPRRPTAAVAAFAAFARFAASIDPSIHRSWETLFGGCFLSWPSTESARRVSHDPILCRGCRAASSILLVGNHGGSTDSPRLVPFLPSRSLFLPLLISVPRPLAGSSSSSPLPSLFSRERRSIINDTRHTQVREILNTVAHLRRLARRTRERQRKTEREREREREGAGGEEGDPKRGPAERRRSEARRKGGCGGEAETETGTGRVAPSPSPLRAAAVRSTNL